MEDPRTDPRFRPELYPRCSDSAPPLDDAQPAAHRQLALLAAYYQINCCAEALQAVRQSAERSPAAERAALQELEKALLARDALEDQFAPYGLVSSPLVENGLITEVSFTSPNQPKIPVSSLSMYFALTPPKH